MTGPPLLTVRSGERPACGVKGCRQPAAFVVLVADQARVALACLGHAGAADVVGSIGWKPPAPPADRRGVT